MYQYIELDSRHRRRSSFTELMPHYGHLVEVLSICIDSTEEDNLAMLGLLNQLCPHLTSIRNLFVNMKLDCTVDRYDPFYTHSTTLMGQGHLQEWVGFCAKLPPTINRLSLSGFTWRDAIEGISRANLPELCSFEPMLGPNSSPPQKRLPKFPKFPKLWSLELTAIPCLEWAPELFADCPITDMNIGCPETHHGSMLARSLQVHGCNTESCPWKTSIREVLSGAAPTLDTLHIGTPSILSVDMPLGIFTALTSLHFNAIHIDGDIARLETLLIPFIASPLIDLAFKYCGKIPSEFAWWFDPASTTKWPRHSHRSGPRWPTLETLSLDQLGTIPEPGDDRYQEGYVFSRPPPDWFWMPTQRKALERFCTERNIELEVDWEWSKRSLY